MSMFQGAIQVAVTGGTQIAVAGTGNSVTISHGQAGPNIALQTLSAATAHTALYDSSARLSAPRCHRNTRTTYLDGLEHWMRGIASDYDDKRLIWINGGAGAGKSAIMQSIAERCAQHAVILGTFFFSRADQSRNYAEVLIPTLAYQLVCAFPDAMTALEPIILRNPLIFKTSLRTQAYELIVRPLLHLVENGVIDTTSPLRRVFVIDGLDECDNREEQAHIIQIVAAILCDYNVPVSFLIASRPETAISRAFHTENRVHPLLLSITLDDDADATSDIHQFIEDSFLDIRDTHPQRKYIPPNWPHWKSIDRLVQKSSGHFIYAATAMKFISSSDELPQRALQVLEGLVLSRTGNPLAALDALYLHILTSTKYSSQVLGILRHCILTKLAKTIQAICFMYPHFSPQDIDLFFSDVQALVSLSPNNEAELCIFLRHASLSDFFQDANRSNELYMSAGDYRASLLPRYFMLFDDSSRSLFPNSRSGSYLIDELSSAIRHSQNIGLLHSLTHEYSPQHVWSFYRGPVRVHDSTLAYHHPRNTAIYAVSVYLASIRDSAANHHNVLYMHHFQTFFPILLDDLNKLVEVQPYYQVIQALLFSSRRCCLSTVAPGLICCFPQPLPRVYSHIFNSYMDHEGVDRQMITHPQAYEAIRTLPQAQMPWGSDLASALELVLQHFLGYRWTSECLALNPRQRWLNKLDPLQHVSQRPLKLPSAVYSYLRTQRTLRSSNGAQLLPSIYWVRRLYEREGSTCRLHERRWQYGIFLRAIIHYLHKCECTSALAKLARRLLPKAALWFPGLMKKARRRMDAYVRRWDESLDGLLEKTLSMALNDMD